MITLTQNHISAHCRDLGISREMLTEFAIPDGIIFINWGAFYDCRSLTSISIPDGVRQICDEAFSGCTSLQSIIIPNSVTKIYGGAFKECESLTFINIPDSVITISQRAFYDCHSLTSITIPDGITSIGNDTFFGCTSLRSITIPDSVTEIGDEAFRYCESLRSITIPDSVTKIEEEAFWACTSLTSIICNNPDLFTDDNIDDRDQIQFISTTDYFTQNYQGLLEDVKPSGFNSNHVSSKELNLIIKLHQEDFLPDWKTLATTFNKRSINQISSILNYFNKTCNAPTTILLHKKDGKNTHLNGISMFLNPKEHTNLYMTAKDIIATTPRQEQELSSELEQEQSLIAPFNGLQV